MPPTQRFFAAAWGLLTDAGGPYPLSSIPALLAKLKSLGYAGIEIPIAFVMKYGLESFKEVAASLEMLVITQVFSSGSPPTPGNLGIASSGGIVHPADASLAGTRDVAGHCAIWAAQVRESARLGPLLVSINSHSGKDYFAPAEADAFFSFATALEAELGVRVNHETHRARVLYSPWVVPRVLEAHPALRFTADLSHFSVVTETGARDPEVCAVVAALTPRVRHVHARVGFEEGPQVPDPRGAHWAPYMRDYEAWWTAIFQAAAARGDDITITPEFGPKDYAWQHAYTGETLNNVWDINHFVAMRLAALHTELFGSGAAVMCEDPEKGVWALA